MAGTGVGVGVELEEGVFGGEIPEVIGSHVGGKEGSAIDGRDVVEIDGVAQAVRDDVLIAAVRIHDGERGADGFFFLAGVAGGTDGDVEVCGAVQLGEGDGAREMPAAVLVAEAVVGEAGEDLGLGARVRIA